jgi:hypothetical protein
MTEVVYTRDQNPDYTQAPVQPRVATLMSMSQEILMRLRNLAAGAGVSLPTRQLIHMSAVPMDCEQVTVAFGGWVGDPAAQGMTVCLNFRWCAQIGVAICRRTPAVPSRTTSAPPVEKMNAAAQVASDDAELLIELAMSFGEVGADLTLSTPEPEGGFQAVLLTATLPAFGGLD